MPRTHAARHDVPIRDCSEIPTILWIVDDGDDRNVLDPHEGGDLRRGCTGRRDDRVCNHHFRCSHMPILRLFWLPGNPSLHTPVLCRPRKLPLVRPPPSRTPASAHLSAIPRPSAPPARPS